MISIGMMTAMLLALFLGLQVADKEGELLELSLATLAGFPILAGIAFLVMPS